MKIAIDIRSTTNENRARGIGVYTANLVEALADLDKTNQYLLLSNNAVPQIKLPQHSKVLAVQKQAHPFVDRLKVKGTLSKLTYDIFLQPDLSYGLPKAPLRVGVVYDFIEQDYPLPKPRSLKESLGRHLRQRMIAKKYRALLSADALVAISQYTARETKRRLPAVADKPIVAIPLGVKPQYSSSPGIPPTNLPTKPYFLYVGGGDSRKNVGALIDAFEVVRSSRDTSLVLVGSDFTNQTIREQTDLRRRIAGSKYSSDIICPGFLPEPEVIWFYHNAAALTFPSLAEGFGLELIEAMAAGCPVICFRGTALIEVAEEAAILVDDQKHFIDAMKTILSDKPAVRDLIKSGRDRARSFTWTRTAQLTLDFLAEVAK